MSRKATAPRREPRGETRSGMVRSTTDIIGDTVSLVKVVYLATVKDQYGCAAYQRVLKAVKHRFPDARIIQSATEWSSNADWRRHWPTFRDTISLLVLWPREGSGGLTVGRGCFAEVADVRQRGIPAIAVTSKGQFFHIAVMEENGLDCWVSFASVELGDEVP